MVHTLIIIVGVVILVKLINILFLRIQKKFISGLSKVSHAEVASVETRMTMIRRFVDTGLYFIAFIIFIFQFESIRNLGNALLASAGVAGIVIGMAAQNTLSNLISGIIISFSQPVRLNDAVIFRGDFGWVEEIMLMHTTIRTWDNRRIVIPNNVLANEVIENWSIKDPSLLGVVMMYVDYTCDVNKVSQWVKEIVNASPYSAKEKVAVAQVVDFTEKSMVLRILAKGPDAPSTWNLRCQIREKMIDKFRKEGLPLPKIRISTEPSPK
jgi:small-conductance mechanosensitive channel